MQLEDLGYNSRFEAFRIENKLESFDTGRVVAEHKERYIVKTLAGEAEAEITGNLRYTAGGREDFPAVGDWVALTRYDTDFALIHKVFPRYSMIKRKTAGLSTDIQIIAANIDVALLVQAADRDFNVNRLERYLTLCYESKVEPVIVLGKTDLIPESRKDAILESIRARIKQVPVIAISNATQSGYGELKALIRKGKTYCMLGSSGVGKSTLLNNLAGKMHMRTDAISAHTNKGKHVTSHRELLMLPGGGILIDNPGMREVGITDSGEGLEITFEVIASLSRQCRFADCSHVHEAGCAVLEALAGGQLSKASYEHYLKLSKERAHYESTAAERRKKDKAFGKRLKHYKKDMDRNQE